MGQRFDPVEARLDRMETRLNKQYAHAVRRRRGARVMRASTLQCRLPTCASIPKSFSFDLWFCRPEKTSRAREEGTVARRRQRSHCDVAETARHLAAGAWLAIRCGFWPPPR